MKKEAWDILLVDFEWLYPRVYMFMSKSYDIRTLELYGYNYKSTRKFSLSKVYSSLFINSISAS